MKQKMLALAITAISVMVMTGCNDDDNDSSSNNGGNANPTVATGDTFALSQAGQQLTSFNRNKPDTLVSQQTIRGLSNNDSLIGIDYRPADGKLYGVGRLGNIYVINPSNSQAELKSKLVADSTDTTLPFTSITGNEALMSVDFNPVADRLRVVGNDGQNLRINVDTGTTITDTVLNGSTTTATITSVAYTNSFAGTGSTRMFDIDVTGDRLYLQNPPNDGKLAESAPLGVNAEGSSSFDIDGITNQGYAVLNVGGTNQFYKINLASLGTTTATTTLVGSLPTGLTNIRGIALKPASDAGITIHGLTANNQLLSFKAGKPNEVTTPVTITGLVSGDTILGIDYRQRVSKENATKSGLLYGLSKLGNVYTINRDTGVATLSTSIKAADGTPIALSGTTFAVDFNPVVDRLRVVSDTGQSLAVNVDDGITAINGSINSSSVIPPKVAAVAYTNSFSAETAPSGTTLFDLDLANNLLATQNTMTGQLTTIGTLGITLGNTTAFDIAGGDNGLALASVTNGSANTSTLYRVNLTTGATTLAVSVNGTADAAASKIGSATTPALIDLAIWLK